MTIEEVVRKVLLDEHADVIREAVKAVCSELMELEVSELIGAEHGERRPQDRATHRTASAGTAPSPTTTPASLSEHHAARRYDQSIPRYSTTGPPLRGSRQQTPSVCVEARPSARPFS
jgi:hypothetical protein